MARKHQRSERRSIARERIDILFKQADIFHADHPDWSDNCIKRARSIATKERMKIPMPHSRRFCRHCLHYLVPGIASVRINRGHVSVTCDACGYIRRYPVNLEK